jgi:hypothetical protein
VRRLYKSFGVKGLKGETYLCNIKAQSVRAVNTLCLGYKNQSVTDVLRKVAVCSESHTKQINAMLSLCRIVEC